MTNFQKTMLVHLSEAATLIIEVKKYVEELRLVIYFVQYYLLLLESID